MVKQRVSFGSNYVRHQVERTERVRVQIPVQNNGPEETGWVCTAPPKGGLHPPQGFAGGVVKPKDVRSLKNKLDNAVKQGEGDRAQMLADLLRQANSLTAADRRELLDQLALQNQLAAKTAANPDLDMWAEAVKTALEDSIGFGGGESYGVMLLKRLLGPSSCWRPVEQFMHASKLDELRRPERLAIYHVLARFLVEECEQVCKHTGAPLSAKFVAGQTGNIGGLFERNFPGYIAAGLAPMVARQMQAA